MTSRDTGLATIDTRPYFERVLAHAVKQGVITDERLATLKQEGAKAIVQLAGYFGTANLRPELEAARTRLVTLVSLALESTDTGALDAGAERLRDKSLLALSKAGADALRSLLHLPAEPYLTPPMPIAQIEKQALSLWTLDEPMTYARFQEELAQRQQMFTQHELSYWLAGKLGTSREELQMSEPCESVINSAFLLLFADKQPKAFFSTNQFIKLHALACKKRKRDFPAFDAWRDSAPPALHGPLDEARERFLDQVLPTLKSYAAGDFIPKDEVSPVTGHFFFDRSSLDELTHHDEQQASAWHRITAGKGAHPDVMCTILLLIAAGLEPRAELRKKDALGLWERVCSHGFDDAAVTRFIHEVVPFQYQSDIRHLWTEDLGPDARLHLNDTDKDRALAYLHDTCRASYKLR